jgi:hypothetical protein
LTRIAIHILVKKGELIIWRKKNRFPPLCHSLQIDLDESIGHGEPPPKKAGILSGQLLTYLPALQDLGSK